MQKSCKKQELWKGAVAEPASERYVEDIMNTWTEIFYKKAFFYVIIKLMIKVEQFLQYLPLLVFITSSLIISIMDIKIMQFSIVPLYIAFFLSSFFYAFNNFDDFLLRILASAALFILFFLARLLTRGKLGWGDLHYSAYCGLVTGFPGSFVAILLSCITASVFFLINMMIKSFGKKKYGEEKRIPFTPFMFLCSIFVVFLL